MVVTITFKQFDLLTENIDNKIMNRKVQLNPDNSNLQGKSKKVRVIGAFELSRVKLVRKLPGGESKKVRVSGRFELLRVRVIGIQLYFKIVFNTVEPLYYKQFIKWYQRTEDLCTCNHYLI